MVPESREITNMNLPPADSGPLCIGLTGNIATGKSTVARMLVELGAEHIDADKLAHQVLKPDGRAYADVIKAFGQRILAPGGREIDRRVLGEIVFTDPAALAQLEELVHPAVIELVNKRIAATQAAVVVLEAIKLLESGLADACTTIWVTNCSPTVQLERLTSIRDLSHTEAEQRISAQPPAVEKIAQADLVIETAGSLAATRAQVERAWSRLLST